MKKVRDFLPEETRKQIEDYIKCCIEEYYCDLDQSELKNVMEALPCVWDQETTAELEGVVPEGKVFSVHMNGKHSYTYKCGNCDNPISLSKHCDFFCRICGTKIDWSAEE